MGFQLVPKSVTLNNLERRNNPLILRYFTEFDSFGSDHVTVVEQRPMMFGAEYPRSSGV